MYTSAVALRRLEVKRLQVILMCARVGPMAGKGKGRELELWLLKALFCNIATAFAAPWMCEVETVHRTPILPRLGQR